MNHYETLGVRKDADAAAIRAAYRKLAKKYHPDLAPEAKREKHSARMSDINKAYEVLSDPERRSAYDQTGSDDKIDLDRLAVDRLMGMFNEWLELELPLPGNLIDHMKKGVEKLTADLKQKNVALRRKAEKVEKKAKRIRGPQVFQDLVAHKVHEIRQMIEVHEQHLEVNDRVIKLLDEYSDTEPEKVEPGVFDYRARNQQFGGGDALMDFLREMQKGR